MTREELEILLKEEIAEIAPDDDLSQVTEDADLREALDLDSMDIVNLLIALHRRLKVDIPDKDAPRLVTLEGAVAYLLERMGRANGPADQR